MASENDRLQSLRQKLDLTRDELDAELKKKADRDKELVASVEKQVEDLRSEIDSILKSRAGERQVASTSTHINNKLCAATQCRFLSSQHVACKSTSHVCIALRYM